MPTPAGLYARNRAGWFLFQKHSCLLLVLSHGNCNGNFSEGGRQAVLIIPIETRPAQPRALRALRGGMNSEINWLASRMRRVRGTCILRLAYACINLEESCNQLWRIRVQHGYRSSPPQLIVVPVAAVPLDESRCGY